MASEVCSEGSFVEFVSYTNLQSKTKTSITLTNIFGFEITASIVLTFKSIFQCSVRYEMMFVMSRLIII